MAMAALGVALSGAPVDAADHTEPPGNDSTAARNIADFYAWHEGGALIAIVTMGGAALPGQAAPYDPDALYGVHIDNDADDVADIDIWVRFGQDAGGNWGVKVENLPGASGDVIGAVEGNLDGGGGTQVFAGLRDDPFFFDLEGFNDTVAMGSLQFASLTMGNARDSLAGTNANAIVLSMDLDAARGGADQIQMWATTARK